MKEFGGGGGVSEGSILIQNQCTHMQMHTYTSAEANPGGLSPLCENPWDFFFLKVVPRVRMSHWPHNGATVTARPPLSSDSRRMPLWSLYILSTPRS